MTGEERHHAAHRVGRQVRAVGDVAGAGDADGGHSSFTRRFGPPDVESILGIRCHLRGRAEVDLILARRGEWIGPVGHVVVDIVRVFAEDLFPVDRLRDFQFLIDPLGRHLDAGFDEDFKPFGRGLGVLHAGDRDIREWHVLRRDRSEVQPDDGRDELFREDSGHPRRDRLDDLDADSLMDFAERAGAGAGVVGGQRLPEKQDVAGAVRHVHQVRLRHRIRGAGHAVEDVQFHAWASDGSASAADVLEHGLGRIHRALAAVRLDVAPRDAEELGELHQPAESVDAREPVFRERAEVRRVDRVHSAL